MSEGQEEYDANGKRRGRFETRSGDHGRTLKDPSKDDVLEEHVCTRIHSSDIRKEADASVTTGLPERDRARLYLCCHQIPTLSNSPTQLQIQIIKTALKGS